MGLHILTTSTKSREIYFHISRLNSALVSAFITRDGVKVQRGRFEYKKCSYVLPRKKGEPEIVIQIFRTHFHKSERQNRWGSSSLAVSSVYFFIPVCFSGTAAYFIVWPPYMVITLAVAH